jgi:hypothetical protein
MKALRLSRDSIKLFLFSIILAMAETAFVRMNRIRALERYRPLARADEGNRSLTRY